MAPNESKFEKFIVPNFGCGSETWGGLYHCSPILNPSVTEFKKHKKIIMNRYHNIEKVKEAEIVGILIGTVVCDNHMTIINALKRHILSQNKKYYEVLVGKINEPKLRNFQFIDLYVIIACPEMSLVEYKKFNMHVVTPHEALMALQPDNFPWEGKIITDYNILLTKMENIVTGNDL